MRTKTILRISLLLSMQFAFSQSVLKRKTDYSVSEAKEWVWFKIKRTDLAMKDERQYKTTSSARLGYYYVDATKDFEKIKDY